MPQPNLPPTPVSSTELLAKDLSRSTLDNAFALPPPALQAKLEDSSRSSTTSAFEHSHAFSREQRSRPRRASTTKPPKQQTVELPPPPSRSRKIIQMKPKAAHPHSLEEHSVSNNGKGKADLPSVAGTKRKAGTPTAAGRKIARKTAHSLIERRRRSKMNEEFATLKDMVPACRGHEMHKLSILQASIDYLRYLQNCVSDLKNAANEGQDHWLPSEMQTSPTFSSMPSTALSTPYLSPELEPQQSSSESSTPRLKVQDDQTQGKGSSTRTSGMDTHSTGSGQDNSPTMSVEEIDLDADQNAATAALLMLNRDRRELGKTVKAGEDAGEAGTTQEIVRSVKPRSSLTGMSVRELLS